MPNFLNGVFWHCPLSFQGIPRWKLEIGQRLMTFGVGRIRVKFGLLRNTVLCTSLFETIHSVWQKKAKEVRYCQKGIFKKVRGEVARSITGFRSLIIRHTLLRIKAIMLIICNTTGVPNWKLYKNYMMHISIHRENTLKFLVADNM